MGNEGSRCASGTILMQKHPFHHCSWWNDQQSAFWQAVRNATGWNASRRWNVQMSEYCSVKKYDPAVMDFLTATDVRKFPAKLVEDSGQLECR